MLIRALTVPVWSYTSAMSWDDWAIVVCLVGIVGCAVWAFLTSSAAPRNTAAALTGLLVVMVLVSFAVYTNGRAPSLQQWTSDSFGVEITAAEAHSLMDGHAVKLSIDGEEHEVQISSPANTKNYRLVDAETFEPIARH